MDGGLHFEILVRAGPGLRAQLDPVLAHGLQSQAQPYPGLIRHRGATTIVGCGLLDACVQILYYPPLLVAHYSSHVITLSRRGHVRDRAAL